MRARYLAWRPFYLFLLIHSASQGKEFLRSVPVWARYFGVLIKLVEAGRVCGNTCPLKKVHTSQERLVSASAFAADHATVRLYCENRIPQLEIENRAFGDALMVTLLW